MPRPLLTPSRGTGRVAGLDARPGADPAPTRRSSMRLLVAATVAAARGLAAASPAFADTLKVPSESYPDIQTAVTAAADGDTVSVAPGTYNEIVMVMDKTNLVIRGRARPVMNGPGFAFTV